MPSDVPATAAVACFRFAFIIHCQLLENELRALQTIRLELRIAMDWTRLAYKGSAVTTVTLWFPTDSRATTRAPTSPLDDGPLSPNRTAGMLPPPPSRVPSDGMPPVHAIRQEYTRRKAT